MALVRSEVLKVGQSVLQRQRFVWAANRRQELPAVLFAC